MVDLIGWFQLNYPDIKRDMQNCQHNFSSRDLNPYHIEGDCWSHTMMVSKVAEMRGYSRAVKLSALLHDMGKPKARRVNPKNSHVQFFGHEKLSAKMAKPIVDKLISQDIILADEGARALRFNRGFMEVLYRSSIDELYERFSDDLEF